MVHRSPRFTILGLLFISALTLPGFAFADSSLSISKVVADVPGSNVGHQYIQITNAGSDAIDLGAKTIRLVDHEGKHLIKSYDGSDTTLVPGASATIAQNPATFLLDNPGFSGTLLKSSFTLTETGTVSIVQTDGTLLATKSYASAPIAKPALEKSSSSSRGAKKASSTKSKTYSSHTSYGKGTTAPADAANAESAGASYALPVPASELAFIAALASNVWFVVFLGLLAFSGFSLMVIQNGSKELQKQKTAFS